MLRRHHHTDKISGKLLCNLPVCTKIKNITEIDMFFCFFTIIKQIDIFLFFYFSRDMLWSSGHADYGVTKCSIHNFEDKV